MPSAAAVVSLTGWPDVLRVWRLALRGDGYAAVLRHCGEGAVFCAATTGTHAVLFWLHSAILLFLRRFSWARRYRIQPQEPDPKLVREAAVEATLGLLLLPAVSRVLCRALQRRGMSFAAAAAPSAAAAAARVAAWHVVFDAWFYWGHRASHHRAVYGTVHKKHHRFKQNYGFNASFASRAEELVVNTGSSIVGPLLFPGHFWCWAVYWALRLHETVEAHSGYDAPWGLWRFARPLHYGPRFHDFHHSHNVGNFGGFAFWDWACGTDKTFRAYEHRRLNGADGVGAGDPGSAD